jgi:YndJ-like protein
MKREGKLGMLWSEKNIGKALAGGAAWLVLLPFSLSDSPEGELIQRILLLGVLVIVPLGLALISAVSERKSVLLQLAGASQPFAALAVIISGFLEQGFVAAGLAVLWLLTTSLIGLAGLISLTRLGHSRGPAVATLSVLAAMIYLPVGAVWLIMSRLGIQPLGFGDTIVLLTAVHFHFAGFAAPLLTGLTGYHLQVSGKIRSLYPFSVICVIAGTPLVAAGITLSPVLALVGAIIISLGLLSLALINFVCIVTYVPSLLPRMLLVISTLSVIPAMALAGVYAYSIVFHKLIVDIPQMAITHGVINAFGFALCGLAAWALIVMQRR